MSRKKNYVIVEFDDGLSIIPSMWLQEDNQKSWWPISLKTKLLITRAIINKIEPNTDGHDWVNLHVHKIFGTADTYSKALDKLVQAEETSHLNTTNYMNNTENFNAAKKKRRKRAHKEFNSDTDSNSKNSYSSDENDPGKLNRAAKSKKRTGKTIGKSYPTIESPPYVSGLLSPTIPTQMPTHTSTPVMTVSRKAVEINTLTESHISSVLPGTSGMNKRQTNSSQTTTYTGPPSAEKFDADNNKFNI